MEYEANLYKERVELVNDKIKLLEVKENLINDKLEIKKRRLEQSEGKENRMEKTRKLNKKENVDEYDMCFNYTDNEERSFLPTVMVTIENYNHRMEKVRGFIDTGAQPNLMSHDLYNKKKMITLPAKRRVVGVHGDPFIIKKKIVLKIYPWYTMDKSEFIKETFWILPCNSHAANDFGDLKPY